MEDWKHLKRVANSNFDLISNFVFYVYVLGWGENTSYSLRGWTELNSQLNWLRCAAQCEAEYPPDTRLNNTATATATVKATATKKNETQIKRE